MYRDVAMKWIADLRSNPDKQGKSVLANPTISGTKYCCLGRLCEVLEIPQSYDPRTNTIFYEGEDRVLAETVVRLAGMESCVGSASEIPFGKAIVFPSRPDQRWATLADANDDGVTFSEIADWIEANWERL